MTAAEAESALRQIIAAIETPKPPHPLLKPLQRTVSSVAPTPPPPQTPAGSFGSGFGCVFPI